MKTTSASLPDETEIKPAGKAQAILVLILEWMSQKINFMTGVFKEGVGQSEEWQLSWEDTIKEKSVYKHLVCK